MRVLIIDDNQHVAKTLKRGLQSSFAVDVAKTGNQGIVLAETTDYDLILLDLNLPDATGSEVCDSLRAKGVTAPIIVVTGRDVLRDKIALLDIGADDYITKPFSLDELKARMRAAMRHAPGALLTNTLRCGDIELDLSARTVKRGQQPIALRRKEFDLLEYLARNQGRTLTRSMILTHLWDRSGNLWANVIDVHIKHLRDKIDRPFERKVIKTVHGVGYRLEP